MKFLLLLPLVYLLHGLPCQATMVTFDDLSNPLLLTGVPITNDYQGMLSWSNLDYKNAITFTEAYGTNGYIYGLVSSSNEAFNAFAGAAEIDSGTNFNFTSVYLTGAWNSNLTIQVEGFNGATLAYNQTVTVSATNSMLFTFNYLNINRLYFNSSGGQDAGFSGGGGAHFVMDDLNLTLIVPEPSSLVMTAMGALTLCAAVKRKRRFPSKRSA